MNINQRWTANWSSGVRWGPKTRGEQLGGLTHSNASSSTRSSHVCSIAVMSCENHATQKDSPVSSFVTKNFPANPRGFKKKFI